MSLISDLKEGLEERAAKKAAANFIEREYLGRASWRERARLAWARFKFCDVAYFCGAVRLAYESILLWGTEIQFVLTMMLCGQSFNEAKQSLEKHRELHHPRFDGVRHSFFKALEERPKQ
jgi:hypothetical protein